MAVRRRFPIVLILCGVFVALLLTASANATPEHSPLYQATPSTPSIISYQGRVLVNGARFNGAGLFKFAVVNSAGDAAYWSNDGTGLGAAPFQPTGHITLTVSNGVFGVALGDTSIAGMTQPITAGIATSPDRSLRVWFNDGALGWQQLAPDVALASVPYALVADSAASATTATTTTFAYSAGVAVSATTATTATFAYSAGVAVSATTATTATFAYSAGVAVSATTATTATFAYNAAVAVSATTAIIGAGVSTRPALWVNTNTLGSNSALVWDDNNYRLGINATLPSWRLTVEDTSASNGEHLLLGFREQIVGAGAFFGYQANGSFSTYGVIRGGGSKPIAIGTSNNKTTLYILDNGNVGIGTTNPAFKLEVNGDIGPTTTTKKLGSSSSWWDEIHYHTLTSHSIGAFTSGVKLQDGRIVSCTEAISYLQPDNSTLMSNGLFHLDYSKLPAAIFRPAVDDTVVVTIPIASLIGDSKSFSITNPETGLEVAYFSTITETRKGQDGADLDAMVSLVLCAANEVNAKSATLESRIAALEKALGVKP